MEVMSATREKVREEALKLDPEDRRDLAYELLGSLDDACPEELDEAWRATILRRVEELRSGKVQAIPLDEAVADLRERLRSRRKA